MSHKVLFKKLHENAAAPSFATEGDAGADLRAVEPGFLAPGEYAAVATGIAVELPAGTVGLVHPRSGLAAKFGITVLNAPGTIDNGYRGELKVILINHGKQPFSWTPGDRIAQFVVQEFIAPAYVETEEFSASERGTGGLGSTGGYSDAKATVTVP